MGFCLHTEHVGKSQLGTHHLRLCTAGMLYIDISISLLQVFYYNRKPVLPIEQEYVPSEDNQKSGRKSIEKYCKKMLKLKKKLFTKVDGNIQDAQQRYKKDYDKKNHRKKVRIIV